MSIKMVLGSLAALAVVSSCATATPYQQAFEGEYGFDEQKIEDRRWSVSFSGNSVTDRERVETYLLYRAAELTQQQGFDHFRIVDSNTDEDRRLYASFGGGYNSFNSGFGFSHRYFGRRGRLFPTRFYGSSFRRSRFGYRSSFHGGFGSRTYDYREVIRYDASAEIIMGNGAKPDDPAFFDAEQVLKNLAGTIERPEI